MYELSLIKQNGGTYIDSREVAELVGKPHNDLMKAIRKYCGHLTAGNFSLSSFFLESTYFDSTGRELPCYLLSKMACELIANKLTGEKGILFTTLYVSKFNQMEAAERAEFEARSVTPQLKVFNTAIRNILKGYTKTYATSDEVMDFLRGAYKPFGINVLREKGRHYLTARAIAMLSGILSETGRPHGHAVASIISKLNIAPEHTAIIPYGMVGLSVRYDEYMLAEVRRWIAENDCPSEIPHLDFEYHLYYDPAWLFLYNVDADDNDGLDYAYDYED
ncbi:MAG: Rha family transcriptional regulator [Defluviitaleaceae bacterium]|nr:Rha family transcriptional regulator [Defluviitaleaceae bacterium]